MARATEIAFLDEQGANRQAHGEERWPLACTALFVLVSSVLLWSMIIAAARWLVG